MGSYRPLLRALPSVASIVFGELGIDFDCIIIGARWEEREREFDSSTVFLFHEENMPKDCGLKNGVFNEELNPTGKSEEGLCIEAIRNVTANYDLYSNIWMTTQKYYEVFQHYEDTSVTEFMIYIRGHKKSNGGCFGKIIYFNKNWTEYKER